MCFSAEADLAIGAFAGVIGIDTLRHVQRPQQLVLAGLPLLLGAHQIDEAFVWWGLNGRIPWPVAHVAIYIFLAFAFLLPFLVPLALFDIEPVRGRREWMAALLALGTVTSALLLFQIIRSPVGAAIDGPRIVYSTGSSLMFLLGLLYVLATCGALIVASSRILALLGLVNLAMVITLSWLTFTALTSLWCAWAAITSVAVAVYLRRRGPRPLVPLHSGRPAR